MDKADHPFALPTGAPDIERTRDRQLFLLDVHGGADVNSSYQWPSRFGNAGQRGRSPGETPVSPQQFCRRTAAEETPQTAGTRSHRRNNPGTPRRASTALTNGQSHARSQPFPTHVPPTRPPQPQKPAIADLVSRPRRAGCGMRPENDCPTRPVQRAVTRISNKRNRTPSENGKAPLAAAGNKEYRVWVPIVL